jgi:hypothetical protein
MTHWATNKHSGPRTPLSLATKLMPAIIVRALLSTLNPHDIPPAGLRNSPWFIGRVLCPRTWIARCGRAMNDFALSTKEALGLGRNYILSQNIATNCPPVIFPPRRPSFNTRLSQPRHLWSATNTELLSLHRPYGARVQKHLLAITTCHSLSDRYRLA